jgi:hypothetical protein
MLLPMYPGILLGFLWTSLEDAQWKKIAVFIVLGLNFSRFQNCYLYTKALDLDTSQATILQKSAL